MDKHLSDVEFSDYALGEIAPRAGKHLLNCAECRRQVAKWESATDNFRSAMRQWNALPAHEVSLLLHRPVYPSPRRWLALCGAAALVLAILGSLVYNLEIRWREESRSAASTPVRASSDKTNVPGRTLEADGDVPLSRIGNEGATSTPAAMAPLNGSSASASRGIQEVASEPPTSSGLGGNPRGR